MQLRLPALTLAAVLLGGTASADHNSRWGEGWANMPNDIHNTRIETRGDSAAFRDLVRYGNGADSDNRFSTSEATDRQQGSSNTRRSRTPATQGRSSSR